MPATKSLTLAQLTDVHLVPITGFSPRYWNVKRGLGWLNWQWKRRFVHQGDVLEKIVADVKAQNPGHIAVTGDLANLGLPEELARAEAWLADLGPPDRVSVIPGNHDIYSGIGNDPGVMRWERFMGPDVARHGFPYLRRIGQVALIGLNSAIETPPFVAAGWLGERQRARTAELLARAAKDGLMCVVMIHHPPLPGQAPARRALKDAAELETLLKTSGADLVIHGHNHADTLMWLDGDQGAIPIVGMASASAGRRIADEPLARYALYRFSRDAITQTVRGLRSFDEPVVEIAKTTLWSVDREPLPAA